MGPDLVLQKTLLPSEALTQYAGVTQTGNESCALPAASGDFCVGFSQDKIVADDVTQKRGAAIRVMGISRCVASEALDVTEELAVLDDGRVRVALEGDFVIGRCVTPVTTAGDWSAVFLTFEGIKPAAA